MRRVGSEDSGPDRCISRSKGLSQVFGDTRGASNTDFKQSIQLLSCGQLPRFVMQGVHIIRATKGLNTKP